MPIQVVNKKYHTPTDKDIYIGRPSILGNPFTHIKTHATLAQKVVPTRQDAIEAYRKYFLSSILLNTGFHRAFKEIKEDSVLVCWCHPSSCHGDILKEMFESGEY